MTLIQIIILTFALFAVNRAWKQTKEGKLRRKAFFAWVIFWIIVSAVALLPQTTQLIASVVGIGRGADLVVYVSLIAVFYLIFRVFVKIESLEGEITKLVRKIALEERDSKE